MMTERKEAEKGTEGLTESTDIALHTKFMKTVPTKMPGIKIEKKIQKQKAVKP